MTLSCWCDSEYDWYYSIQDEETQCDTTRECYGCSREMSIGDTARAVAVWEVSEDGGNIESNVIRSVCEQCGDMYDNLSELGYCLEATPGFIKDAHEEYIAMLPPTHILKGRKK